MKDTDGPYKAGDIFITAREYGFQLNPDTADLANSAFTAGRASRDRLRNSAVSVVKRWNTCGLGLGDEELIRALEKALEADGEGK